MLGKAEFLNPGGSVKDRAAKYIILDAEERGDLQPGGVVVEGTAGNTGIGLALVGNARGYRTVILMPDTQSQEKKDMLRLCGVELRCVPAVPYKDPNHYVKQAERYAQELAKSEPNGVLYANQWDNLEQPQRPRALDRPRDLGADRRPRRRLHLRDRHRRHARGRRRVPEGARTRRARSSRPTRWAPRCTSWIKHGVLESEGSSITEGIGQGRVTGNIDGASDRRRLPDPRRRDAADRVLDLLQRRGPVPGRLERHQRGGRDPPGEGARPGHTVVTVLADYGTRYQSKLFNPAFLRAKGLPAPDWLDDEAGPSAAARSAEERAAASCA